MNKNIFIVRHGHADFESDSDYKRELTNIGKQAVEKTALFISDRCKELGKKIELCISSAALRTQQTSQIICQINSVSDCQHYQELYSCAVSDWLNKISNVSDGNILIVGHNPTFSQMINNLCGQTFHMKPADCAHIKLKLTPDGFAYPAKLINFHQNE